MEYKALISAVPYQSVKRIMSKLQLSETEFEMIREHREIFVSRKEEFADFFYDSFIDLRETHIVLEHFGRPEMIKNIWANWLERLFTENLDDDFIAYLWRIGLKHVEINLDQRFSNLGFSLVRQFCRRIAMDNFPAAIALELISAVDKLVDFCVLVETSAYIDGTVRCDAEILKGIADKIRNPVTIIGGNLRRLQRHIDPEIPLFEDYEFLISSTRQCEDMIEDINTYMEVFQREARLEECMIETIIDHALEKLSSRKKLVGIKVEVAVNPAARFVRGDPIDLRHLFYHALENAAEATHSAKDPHLSISCQPRDLPPHTVRIEVFNNGDVINLSAISNVLTPFFSTKSKGSGLGLSIVKLAVRKNYGELDFEPVPGKGTRVVITLQKVDGL
jgi:signal transduction histidine kinase